MHDIIEYETVFENIKDNTKLNGDQVEILFSILNEYPDLSTEKIYDITDDIIYGDQNIIDTYFENPELEPMLFESGSKTTINLLEIALPVIKKHIPYEMFSYLNEKHAYKISKKIMEISIEKNNTALDIRNRIDEMFAAGDISIPLQGLKNKNKPEVTINGIFGPMLYKKLNFKKSIDKNKMVVKDLLDDESMFTSETPLSKILPKYYMKLKNI